MDTFSGMQLKDWLRRDGVRYSDFAERIGVANASVVSKYANGRIPRDRMVMAAIQRETEGEVGPSDWFQAA